MANKWILPITAVLCLSVGAAGGAYVNEELGAGGSLSKTDQTVPSSSKEWTKLEEAYELIYNQYVEKVESSQLVEGAIQGMLSSLDDPYSVYMDKQAADQFNESLDSSFEGIGTEISMEDHKVIIVAPYKDSPAEKAGLKPGDELLKVNGESVEGLNLEEVRVKIRGKKGTKVSVEVKRDRVNSPLTLTMTRDEIPMNTVSSSVMEGSGKRIGYIEITMFAENTAADFSKQLKELEKVNVEGLVLDVRGNPGGLLSSVESILGELVPKDKPILQIEERSGKKQAYYTKLSKPKEYPIVVLTDNGSASASEILAGAMKEAGGYKLIGEKTFGKGTVQQAWPMGDGSNIKMTLFKWLTPDGTWIHKKGIEPDIDVRQPAYFNLKQLDVEKTLMRDMNGETIQHAQEMLKVLGFEPGRTDGYFSTKTEAAVKAFQRYKNLKMTGTLTKETAAALTEAAVAKVTDKQNDVQLRTALKIAAAEK